MLQAVDKGKAALYAEPRIDMAPAEAKSKTSSAKIGSH